QLGAEQIQPIQFYSQATQDRFVYTFICQLLDKQNVGYYLEIGAWHPVDGNNTYFFEKNYDWKGISIDISEEFMSTWHSTRKNPLLIQDAKLIDYHAILHS